MASTCELSGLADPVHEDGTGDPREVCSILGGMAVQNHSNGCPQVKIRVSADQLSRVCGQIILKSVTQVRFENCHQLFPLIVVMMTTIEIIMALMLSDGDVGFLFFYFFLMERD